MMMARNLVPMKSLRVSIKDPESPRMKALNGGAAASGTLYTYPDNFRLVNVFETDERGSLGHMMTFEKSEARLVTGWRDYVYVSR